MADSSKIHKKLSEQQKDVLLGKGTEAPFSGKLLYNKEAGYYNCAACGQKLFHSEAKFDSGSGWPSFYDVAVTDAIKLAQDNSLGEPRIEVMCGNCGSHLGHVFNDAPDQPTGMRFCVNSLSLDFTPNKQSKP